MVSVVCVLLENSVNCSRIAQVMKKDHLDDELF